MDALNKLGIFSLSLLATASAVYLYSPVIGSHAADNMTSKVSAEIAPVASVTLDTNNLNFSITPTEAGVFDSKPVVVTVDTNSTGGYELYFSSVDNATDMVNTNPTIDDVIASDFNSAVTSTTMAKNKWGYSLDNTNFNKIPTLASNVKLKDLDHFPSSSEKNTTVHIGTKIANDLKAGTYSKNVLFSVIAHETPIPTMQGFDKSTLVNVGDSATLQDTRDGNVYTVKKLADGNVWMTENLRIAGKTITSADSNVTSDFTIPASSKSGFNAQDTNNAYVDSTYGGYYTFYTATAGTGGTSLTSGNAPSSICPKGWRLPTGGRSTGEFQTLYNNYNSASQMMGEPNFTLSGYVRNGSVYSQGDFGYFWSSTVYNANRAYGLSLGSSNVGPGYDDVKSNGNSVRCVAR